MLERDATPHRLQHIRRQLGRRIGLDFGLVEYIEHALHARQRTLHRVDGVAQLRYGLACRIDVLEKRLEYTDGHTAGNKHIAAHDGDDNLREPA